MVKWRITINGEVIETSNLRLELGRLIHRYGFFRAKNVKYGKGGLISYGEYHFPRANKTAIIKMIEGPGKAVVRGTPKRYKPISIPEKKKEGKLTKEYCEKVIKSARAGGKYKSTGIWVPPGCYKLVSLPPTPKPASPAKRKTPVKIAPVVTKTPATETGERKFNAGKWLLFGGGLFLALKLLKR